MTSRQFTLKTTAAHKQESLNWETEWMSYLLIDAGSIYSLDGSSGE
jgi:hypothetical protein